MGIAFMSTYLVAYSSIIKLMLDQGNFEPKVIKQNGYLVIAAKLLFLTFIGPIYIIFVEIASTLQATSQFFAMIGDADGGFDSIKNSRGFTYVFESMLMLNEERAEGLR